jgi:glycyl-tRNA synthetase
VIETAVGCDRLFLAFMCDAYREEVTISKDETGKESEDVRVVLGPSSRHCTDKSVCAAAF